MDLDLEDIAIKAIKLTDMTPIRQMAKNAIYHGKSKRTTIFMINMFLFNTIVIKNLNLQIKKLCPDINLIYRIQSIAENKISHVIINIIEEEYSNL
jgi:hypothetical protein